MIEAISMGTPSPRLAEFQNKPSVKIHSCEDSSGCLHLRRIDPRDIEFVARCVDSIVVTGTASLMRRKY